jgi:hypothetical protein
MIKRTIVISLALVVFLSACSKQTNDIEKDFRVAPLDGGKSLEIARYAGEKQIISIPSRLHGMSVTGIGRGAFQKKELIKVTIPNSITNIGDGAFDSNLLTSITIPGNVTSIGNGAFAGNLLASVTIPGNVTSIGNSAFVGNPLTSVKIGENVTLDNSFGSDFETVYDIGKQAGTYGRRDTNRTSRWGKINGNFLVIGIGTPEVTIASYTGSGGTVTIPESIEKTPVTAIGDGAFLGSQLTKVTIPNSVTTIGTGAFEGNKLTGITIPDSVTTIGEKAFAGNQLTSVAIPGSVTTIGDGAFIENQLASVTIPHSVTSIGATAFAKNPLTNLSITSDNVTYTTKDYFLLSKDEKQLIMYYGSEKDVTIPDGITTIGERAFAENQLVSVAIPGSVTAIGNGAFRENQLTSIIIPDSVRRIGANAFAENKIISITIGASVEGPSIDRRFDELYNRGRNTYYFYDVVYGFGRTAGTYIKRDNEWHRQ